jgi:hypothetical protein
MVILMVGDKATHWTGNTVSALLKLCESHSIRPPSVLRWLPASRPEADDLLDVLQRSRNCSATDPRDKLYALLGLVSRQISDTIPVDYSRTTHSIFTDLAVQFMRLHGRIDALVYADNSQMDNNSLPSWVPRWDVKTGSQPLPPQFSPSQIELLAESWHSAPSRNRPKSLSGLESSNDAHVGFRFEICDRDLLSQDLAKILPPCLRIRAHHLDTVTSMNTLYQDERGAWLPYYLPEAFGNLRNPCANCFLKASNGIPEALEWAASICSTVPPSYELPNSVNTTIAPGPAGTRQLQLCEAFQNAANRLRDGMDVFTTQRSAGIARECESGESVQASDEIWALAGLHVPVVLRRIDDHHIFIRECYLFRATLPILCAYCGVEVKPWPMVTEIIDIW